MEIFGLVSFRICCIGEIVREILSNKVEREMIYGSCFVYLCILFYRWVNMVFVLEILGCSFIVNY